MSEWISVKEKQNPIDPSDVMVCHKKGHNYYIMIGFYRNGKFSESLGVDDWPFPHEPTHWMYKPKPPEQE